jgi:hypothetical protein
MLAAIHDPPPKLFLRGAGDARVLDFAIHYGHAGFASVGVDATVADRQCAIAICTYPTQRIENRHPSS